MSAPLIIRERGGVPDRQEVVLMLHGFSFRAPHEIYALFRAAKPAPAMNMQGGMAMGQSADKESAVMAMDLNDVVCDTFLANDCTLTDPEVVRVEPGDRVLLRVINGSAASNYLVDLGPVQAKLVAVDGHPVQEMAGSAFPVAIAQRIDLAFQLSVDQSVVLVFAVLESERRRTGIVLATKKVMCVSCPSWCPRPRYRLTLRLRRACAHRATRGEAGKSPAGSGTYRRYGPICMVPQWTDLWRQPAADGYHGAASETRDDQSDNDVAPDAFVRPLLSGSGYRWPAFRRGSPRHRIGFANAVGHHCFRCP